MVEEQGLQDAVRRMDFPRLLETQRLVMRPLEEADITERYLSWFRHPEVVLYLESRDLTREQVADHLRAGQQTGSYLVYAICLRDTGQHIGNIKLGPVLQRHLISDVVTVIGEHGLWGRGFAREAIQIVGDAAFERMGLRKLSAGVYSKNIASLKTYLAAGWKIEGVLYGHHEIGGAVQDRVQISRFNPEFFPQLPPLPAPPPVV